MFKTLVILLLFCIFVKELIFKTNNMIEALLTTLSIYLLTNIN